MTTEEQATNYHTFRHIERVRNLLNMCVQELLHRGELHDQSKLESPEVELFTEYTSKLATCTYGSPEYEGFKKAMGPALAHHYANNRHHPEHHKNGIDDMNLLDVVEMLCDWKKQQVKGTMMGTFGNPLRSMPIGLACLLSW